MYLINEVKSEERLYLLSKIEKCLQKADAGKTVSHDEAK
jgi:hypothetical protein